MKRLTTRQYAILTQLIENEGFINSDQLSILVGAAGKTIRKDIEQMIPRLYEEYGIDIESKSGLGFCLHHGDEATFKRFLSEFHDAYQSIYPYTNNDYRMHYLMQRLLSADHYVKISDLCEEIYTSRTIITSSLKMIRRIFADYDLVLEHLPNHGLIVNGKERCKRICLINEYMYYLMMKGTPYEVKEYRTLFEIDEDSLSAIRETLFGFLRDEKNYIISHQGAEKVILAIILMVNRNKQGYPVSFTGEESFNTHYTFSYEASKHILTKLSKILSLPISNDDMTFIGIIMLGFRNILSYDEVHVKNRLNETVPVVDDALEFVAQQTGLREFISDQSLKERLAMHLVSMNTRFRYNMIIDYVSGDLVNKKCPLAVELAVLTCNFIQNRTSFPINRCEVMYMAYFFMPALTRIERPKAVNKKIAIISQLGRDVAVSIAETVFNRFPRFARDIEVFEEYQRHLIKDDVYDYILTDLPEESFETKKTPFIPFDFYLREEDVIRISDIYHNMPSLLERFKTIFRPELFFRIHNCTNINAIMHEAAQCVQEKIPDINSLESDIRIRDHLTPLENGNGIAFFKTLENYCDETFAAVFFLDKPIIWFRESVQCLIMISLGEKEKEDLLLFTNCFEHFLNDSLNSMDMLKTCEYDNFMKCLECSVRGRIS